MDRKRGLILGLILGLVVALSGFVFAEHLITTSSGGTSFNFDEDITNLYNITVNNTELTSEKNITEVKITLPGGFSFTSGSNFSDVGGTFSNTSNTLTWNNSGGLVMNLSLGHFAFNATATTPGNYNLTVTTTNATGWSFDSNNLNVTINDTTVPLVTFNTPTNGTTLSQNYIIINVSASDNVAVDRIILRLYNSSNILINTTSSAGASHNVNITNLSEGVYYYNISVNDTKNNVNNSATRSFRLDTTAPDVTLKTPADEGSWTSSNDVQFKFNVSDVLIANCTLIITGDTTENETDTDIDVDTTQTITHNLDNGDYHWKITCVDYTGHSDTSSTWDVTVDYTESSDGSGDTPTSWTASYYPTALETQEGFAKVLRAMERVRVIIGTESHYVGVISLTSTRATINISSTPQQAIFSVGETKSFEVTGDDYYDIKVRLNSVNSTAANVTTWAVYDLMPVGATSGETTETTTSTTNGTATTGAGSTSSRSLSSIVKNKWFWIVVGAIVLIAVGTWYYLRRRKRTAGY